MSSRPSTDPAKRRRARTAARPARPRTSAPGSAAAPVPGWQAGRLDAVGAALELVLAFQQPADVVLSGFFRANRHLGQRDRAIIAETIYDILRHLRWMRKLSPEGSPRALLLAYLVKLRGFSAGALAPLARNDEMDWLQSSRASGVADITPAERLDLPDWLYERLLTQYGGEELETLGRALQAAAPLDLRVNTLKSNRSDMLQALAAQGLEAQAMSYSPDGIRMTGKPAINLLPQYLEGALEVQDEGSQLITHLLAPRRRDLVVDFCAGAGGKTLALGAAMASQGRLYAFDISDRRLAALRPRLKRSGLSNVFPQRITGVRDSHVKRLAGKADRVLLDVPCTGMGTLRRNPDLKWRTRETDLAEMCTKQAEILHFASDLVKPGGRLVYATCSLLKEENEDVVDAFLRTHAGFHLLSAAQALSQARVGLDTGEYLRLRPDRHGTDGFFAAILQRDPA